MLHEKIGLLTSRSRCVCVCACTLRIVSLDKTLHCRNTLITIVCRLHYCDHDYDAVSVPLLLQGGETSQGDVEERDMCDMQVYDDPLFMLRVSRFPYTTSSATGIYIQASAPNSTYQFFPRSGHTSMHRLFPMSRPYQYAPSFSNNQAIPVCAIFFPMIRPYQYAPSLPTIRPYQHAPSFPHDQAILVCTVFSHDQAIPVCTVFSHNQAIPVCAIFSL